jgi:phosphate transport system protein
MFKTLIDLFRKENLITQTIAETSRMIQEDKLMFEEAVRSLRHSDTAELSFDIVAKDKMINKYEREVRRKVITHLTVVGNEQSLTAGLVLISIVIDVERIGDYTKNIVELALAHPQQLRGGMFEDNLRRVEEIIKKRFDAAEEAFGKSDEQLAKRLMREHRPISSECDRMINDIIAEKDKSLSTGDAVVLALYIRFVKRVSAHLTNIVSSVANPFPRIGFRDKDGDSQ